jgi:hypothetical protein
VKPVAEFYEKWGRAAGWNRARWFAECKQCFNGRVMSKRIARRLEVGA